MPKLTFDNLHPTKKHAFIDGFITALCLLWFLKPLIDTYWPPKND